jgi:hypothetical protein
MIPRVVNQFLYRTDELLRGREIPSTREPSISQGGVANLLLTTVLFGMAYGATMGTFGALHGDRWLQIVFSAIKVPMLLLVSFCLSMPSFFVLNSVLSVRSDFYIVVRALVAAQAGLTVVLASLAPLTAFWYVSDQDYQAALTFNAAMFGVATLCGQWLLRRTYRSLIAQNLRHRLLLIVWLIIYSFVTVQMAWVLRPFIGSTGSPVSFFRREAWGNAYVELLHDVIHAFGR